MTPSYTPVQTAVKAIISIALLIFCEIFLMSKVHAAGNDGTDIGFAISRFGGHGSGTNGIGVRLSGTIRVGLSDTFGSTVSGVGVTESALSLDDLAQARDIHKGLCRAAHDGPKSEVEKVEPATGYSVSCLEDGNVKRYQGKTYDLPRNLSAVVDAFYVRTRDAYAKTGDILVKLDVSVANVRFEKGRFLVSIDFINSGRLSIKMYTPNHWRPGDRLEVGGKSADGLETGAMKLAGLPLENQAEFPEEIVTIPAKSKVTFRFVTVPVQRIKHGSYQFSALVATGISGEGAAATMGLVNFLSDQNRAFPIEHDYPSTPEERQQWEATHRADMSLQPVKPGETFAEDGLYRAAGLSFSSSQRSLQLSPFKAGDVATTENVRMPIDGGNGFNLSGPVQWLWEATAPTPVKQWSFDMIPDTVQFCAPGAECPRSGRWVARIDAGSNSLRPEYRLDFASLVTLRRGQRMPSIRIAGERAEWEWVGA